MAFGLFKRYRHFIAVLVVVFFLPVLSSCGAAPPAASPGATGAAQASDGVDEPPVTSASADTPSPTPTGPVLLWADEFDTDGLPDDSIWDYDVGGGGWGNNELEFYTKGRLENARVENGKLYITALRDPEKGSDYYTSARLVTRGKKSIQYGRLEVSAMLPKGVGTWPAIWLMPVDSVYGGWPKSGEIDLMEHVGFDQGRVHFTLHSGKYYWQTGTQVIHSMMIDDCSDTFHVYAMDWRPGAIDFYVDDQLVFETRFDIEKDGYEGGNAWPFDRPFYLIMNLAVGGNWGGQQGVDESVFPQSLVVDYVRVYDTGYSRENDTTPPSQVTGIKLKKVSSGYTLAWQVSTDNYAVEKYEVIVDGKAKYTTLLPNYNFQIMRKGETHDFLIISYDAAGNKTETGPVSLTAE